MRKDDVEKWILEKIGVKAEFNDAWRTGKWKELVIAVCRDEREQASIMKDKKIGKE
jgi:hypothetical protein